MVKLKFLFKYINKYTHETWPRELLASWSMQEQKGETLKWSAFVSYIHFAQLNCCSLDGTIYDASILLFFHLNNNHNYYYDYYYALDKW